MCIDKDSIALYIHFPYCRRKCLYCDFHSQPPENADFHPYFKLLEKEADLRLSAPLLAERRIRSLYIGGGTPSLADPRDIASLMDFFSAKSGFSENAEITLEANPESMTARKISQWKEVGINRLSIGVQTFDDDILSYIGRLADGKTALESLATARKIGFSNINADLMFGLPFQTESGFLDDMRRCLEEGITHLSLYSLLSHEGDGLSLKMAQDHPPIPDERSLYDSASAFLERSGFSCYEISNFCREGFRSVHNMAYWLYEEYLGLGTSAVSRIGQLRWKNTCDESLYRQGLETGHFPVQETERLSLDDMEKEFIMTNLRTSEGLSFQRFASMFGKGFLEEYGEIVRELAGLGLIAQDEGGVRITQEGRFVSNSIILRFFG